MDSVEGSRGGATPDLFNSRLIGENQPGKHIKIPFSIQNTLVLESKIQITKYF